MRNSLKNKDTPKRPMGQPTKLTPARSAIILKLISEGNYYNVACAAAGIAFETYRGWMLRGEEDTEGIYHEFFVSFKKAEAEAEARLVEQWVSQCPEDWKATATFLERRHPERWGRRDRMQLEHTGEGGGPINVEYRFATIQKVISSGDSRAEISKAWRDRRTDTQEDDEPEDFC